MDAFTPFVCKATRIFCLEDAHWQLDDSIAEALRQSKPGEEFVIVGGRGGERRGREDIAFFSFFFLRCRSGEKKLKKHFSHQKKSPVYINIACNIVGLSHPTFEREPIPFVLPERHTNPDSLEAAVETALELLSSAVKPVLVGGVKIRTWPRREAFERLAKKSAFATAIMPNAKGMVSEKLERFLGIYWGQVRKRERERKKFFFFFFCFFLFPPHVSSRVFFSISHHLQVSSPYCAEAIESSDCYIFVGPVMNDYTSVRFFLFFFFSFFGPRGRKRDENSKKNKKALYFFFPLFPNISSSNYNRSATPSSSSRRR